jgi:hypothetical protein
MVESLDVPDPARDVRLWVDRRFSIRGAGTVVTGTLPAGTVSVGDSLDSGSAIARIRGVQSLGEPVQTACGVARVALNLTGADLSGLDRGDVLVTPDAWHFTDLLDGRHRSARCSISVRPRSGATVGRFPASSPASPSDNGCRFGSGTGRCCAIQAAGGSGESPSSTPLPRGFGAVVQRADAPRTCGPSTGFPTLPPRWLGEDSCPGHC